MATITTLAEVRAAPNCGQSCIQKCAAESVADTKAAVVTDLVAVLPKQERRRSGSDSEASSAEDSTGGTATTTRSSLGESLESWALSSAPISWADEVENESVGSDDREYFFDSSFSEPQRAAEPDFQAPNPVAEHRTSRGSKNSRPTPQSSEGFAQKGAVRKNSNYGRNGCHVNPGTPNKSGARGAAAVTRNPTSSCTTAVLQILQEGRPTDKNYGWEALQQIWNVGPWNLDGAVLACLSTKEPIFQEHTLLSFASIDLSNVKNMSAYLNCLLKEHDTSPQVCLYFLAGLCENHNCPWVHPVNTRGWNALRDNWNVTYKEMDYTVLNFLSKKSVDEQDDILASLAAMDLRSINNLSAYLSSMIHKYDSFQSGGSSTPPHSKGGRRNGSFNNRQRPRRSSEGERCQGRNNSHCGSALSSSYGDAAPCFYGFTPSNGPVCAPHPSHMYYPQSVPFEPRVMRPDDAGFTWVPGHY